MHRLAEQAVLNFVVTYEGGTTPSIGMVKVMRENLHINLNVIIRPRGADFLYSTNEFEVMKANIIDMKDTGIDGVVIGLLLPNGEVNIARTKELMKLANPLFVTFHRAFDVTADAFIGVGCNYQYWSTQNSHYRPTKFGT